MDTVIEQLVKKNRTGIDIIKIILIIICNLIFVCALAVLSFLLPSISFLLTIVAVSSFYLCYYLIIIMNIEYEYIMVNDELDIDKIIAKRKRNRLLSVEIKSFESFGKFKEEVHGNKSYTSRIYASIGPNSENLHYATFEHRKYGSTLLVFNPGENLIENIKKLLPAAKRNDD